MPPLSAASPSLGEIFNALTVLTGNPTAAEAALLAGIESMPCAAEGGEQLRDASLAAALRALRHAPAHLPDHRISNSLPAELQRVAELPFSLRACFVLRLLMRLPLACCVELLGKSAAQIGDELQMAVQHLACEPCALAACA